MSIFPYIYYMVRDFNITDDETKISFYAGLVTSSFTFAEFSTSLFWGRLSDKIGRKPVLLMGLGGTGLSVLLFGFAQTLPVALFARALGGFLNGYVFHPPFLRRTWVQTWADAVCQQLGCLADNGRRTGYG
jgi:MFS family permease